MHDAAEAYIGDVVKPLKDQLPQYLEAEKYFEAVLFPAFGLPETIPTVVRQMDMTMLATEKVQLMNHAINVDWGEWLDGVEPLDPDTWIDPRNPSQGKGHFLTMFYHLLGERQYEALRLASTECNLGE